MTVPRLLAADEQLHHQVVDTFASPGQADLSWTEKIWAAVHLLGSEYQVGFGIGKYTNRGVMDGFAGVSRGTDQKIVRSSRELGSDPEGVRIGPIRYEIVEPLRKIRIVLEPIAQSDIAFDITMDMPVPPQVEARWPFPRRDGHGLANDVLRYHQCGTATGWLKAADVQIEFARDRVHAFRDHSWGIKPGVGTLRTDTAPTPAALARYRIWAPITMRRPDDTIYSLFVSYLCDVQETGVEVRAEAAVEALDGSRHAFAAVRPRLQIDPETRDLLGGEIELTDAWGNRTVLRLRRASNTAFYIGAGGYQGGYAGHALGQWHGPQWADSVEIRGVDRPELRARLYQTKDVLFEVRDDSGNVGHANVECIVSGLLDRLPL